MIFRAEVENPGNTDKVFPIFNMVAYFSPVRADSFNGIHHQHQRVIGIAAESTDICFCQCFIVFFILGNDGLLGVIICDSVNGQYAALREQYAGSGFSC